MNSVLHTTRLLKRSEALMGFRLAGDPRTEERRYVEAVAAKVARIGKRRGWKPLAAAIIHAAASATVLHADTRAQARILSRALSSR